MAKYDITAPDGHTYEVEAPDNAPESAVLAYAQANYSKLPAAPKPTMTQVVGSAGMKAVAGLADTVLNTPDNLMNLGRAAVGTGAIALGRPDLAPAPVPTPDFARRGLEAAGLINKSVVPQGMLQKGADLVTQGAVGGALTGGGSIARTAMGAGMGALSTTAGGAVGELTGKPELGIAASLLAPAGAAKAMSGSKPLRPEAQALRDENVNLTPGQIRGGSLQRMEDAATSFPVMGDAIQAAKRRGVESFDAAAINRSLAPIGEKLPGALKGNAAIEYANAKLGDAYERLLPNLKGDMNYTAPANALPSHAGQAAPASLRQELDGIKQMGARLPQPQQGQLNRIIEREITSRFTSSGLASGETLKDIESKLGKLAKGYRKSDDYDVQTMGGAVEEAQAALRRMVERVNPNYQGELSKINEGWANFKRVQNAAGRVGAPNGVFSAPQLHSAVRAQDSSKDKARFAEGNALMQDLSTAGKAVLPSTVPDSGTALRHYVGLLARHPILGTAGVAGAGLYSPAAQSVLQSLMTRKPNPAYGEVAGRVAPVTANGTLQELYRQSAGQ